jgi:hypothetical protein
MPESKKIPLTKEQEAYIRANHKATSVSVMQKNLKVNYYKVKEFLQANDLEEFIPLPHPVKNGHPWRGRNTELSSYTNKALSEYRVSKYLNHINNKVNE